MYYCRPPLVSSRYFVAQGGLLLLPFAYWLSLGMLDTTSKYIVFVYQKPLTIILNYTQISLEVQCESVCPPNGEMTIFIRWWRYYVQIIPSAPFIVYIVLFFPTKIAIRTFQPRISAIICLPHCDLQISSYVVIYILYPLLLLHLTQLSYSQSWR